LETLTGGRKPVGATGRSPAHGESHKTYINTRRKNGRKKP